MITETTPSDPQLAPGAAVDTRIWKSRHLRLNKLNSILSWNMMFLLECDSNNGASPLTPDDARNINLGWSHWKDEKAFALKFKDSPAPAVELMIGVQIPSINDVQGMKNMKLQSLQQEYYHLALVTATNSSSTNLKTYVADDMARVLNRSEEIIDSLIARLIGTGEMLEGTDLDNPIYNLGSVMPNYEVLGDVRPSVNMAFGTLHEPSKDVQPSNFPDVPDRK